MGRGWGGEGGGSSVGRALDWHAADTGFTPQCGKGLFSLSQFSAQTLLHAQSHAYLHVKLKDPMVLVRVQ